MPSFIAAISFLVFFFFVLSTPQVMVQNITVLLWNEWSGHRGQDYFLFDISYYVLHDSVAVDMIKSSHF